MIHPRPMLARAFAAASLLSATACLPIPHREITHPRAEFDVRDAAGAPVTGATVHLYGGYIVGKATQWTAALTADSAGRAFAERAKAWHLFVVLAADGEAPMVWAWCAESAGRMATGALEREPSAPVRVTIADSSGTCPAHPRSLSDVSRAW